MLAQLLFVNRHALRRLRPLLRGLLLAISHRGLHEYIGIFFLNAHQPAMAGQQQAMLEKSAAGNATSINLVPALLPHLKSLHLQRSDKPKIRGIRKWTLLIAVLL